MNCVRMGVWVLLIAAAAKDQSSHVVLPSGVEVTIVEAPFVAADNTIVGCDGGPRCLINGRVPFGVFTRTPRTYVRSIHVTYGGKSYPLDVSDMYDAWGQRPLAQPNGIRYLGGHCRGSQSTVCVIRGLWGDGAAAFAAEWMVIDGVVIRSMITTSGDVIGLFMKHIDPPMYE